MRTALVISSLMFALLARPCLAEAEALAPEEQLRLAVEFAPVLVFHPDEKYLPCSPELWAAGQDRPDPSSYGSWPLTDKGREAVMFYRVYRDDLRYVIEYWAYYAYNEYRAGGGLFGVWSDASHANDLEFIFLILSRDPATEALRIEKSISSAHRINNVHNFTPPGEVTGRLRFLVELGSHAAALDLNGDGRFEPSLEGRSSSKIVWGIRDKGDMWANYSPDLAVSRNDGEALILSPENAGSSLASPRQFTYRLRSVAELEPGSPAWQGRLPRSRLSWHTRAFGKPDGGSLGLALPSRHENFGKPGRAENNRVAIERGAFVGYTPILYDYTLIAGARYTHPIPSRYLPDVGLDTYAMLCGDGHDYYEVQAVGTYPVDAMSTVFAGCAFLGDSIDFNDRQLDWIAGVEVRLNRFRFRPAFRSTGKVSSAWLDFRLMWFF